MAGAGELVTANFGEFLSFLGTGVKIVSAAAHLHSFGVAPRGPWITSVNKVYFVSLRPRNAGRPAPLVNWLRVAGFSRATSIALSEDQ